MTPSPEATAALAQLRAAVAAIESSAAPEPAEVRPDQPSSGGVRPDQPTSAEATPDQDRARARAVVLRHLAHAPRTRHQLASTLAGKGIDSELADDVLDRFEDVGLVDDEAFAQEYVRAAQARRGLSAMALAHELRAKGVGDEVIQRAVDGLDPADEVERARDLVRRRLPRMHGLDRQTKVRRLGGLLARKGYPSHLVRRVVLDEVGALAEHRRD